MRARFLPVNRQGDQPGLQITCGLLQSLHSLSAMSQGDRSVHIIFWRFHSLKRIHSIQKTIEDLLVPHTCHIVRSIAQSNDFNPFLFELLQGFQNARKRSQIARAVIVYSFPEGLYELFQKLLWLILIMSPGKSCLFEQPRILMGTTTLNHMTNISRQLQSRLVSSRADIFNKIANRRHKIIPKRG